MPGGNKLSKSDESEESEEMSIGSWLLDIVFILVRIEGFDSVLLVVFGSD